MRDLHLPGRSPVFAENGMCATSHPLAAEVAVATLKSGGNAMDAAIAGAVLLGICEPQMTGLGGDCFVLYTLPGEDRIRALNGSGRAPAALDAAALRDEGLQAIPPEHPAAVTMPGAVDAFCRLADETGRLGLPALLQPAIDYAESGVPVAPRVAFDWAGAVGNLQGAARGHYLHDGRAPRVGALFRSPGQAEVLRRIARDGRRAFYEGEVAEDMLAALTAVGGVHTAEDFAAVEATPTEPISGRYGGLEVVEHPPNGQGAAALLMLNILARFDLAGLEPFGVERTHLEAEAAKLAYDARNRLLADPEVHDATARMTDPALAEALAALIDPEAAMGDPAPLTEAVHRDTIYITVIDRDRMAVSLIYSIFRSFGSGIASPKFGILMHNRGSGFSLAEGHPNEAAGGRRPMHTIIPGMLRTDGRLHMAFGVMGGAYQAAGHARFVTNLADYGLNPQAAIDAPRAFPDQGRLRVERGYAAEVRDALAGLGHDIEVPTEPIGGAQAIRIHHDLGVLEGASDPRKDGCALGY